MIREDESAAKNGGQAGSDETAEGGSATDSASADASGGDAGTRKDTDNPAEGGSSDEVIWLPSKSTSNSAAAVRARGGERGARQGGGGPGGAQQGGGRAERAE